jgi:hypothetical protein
MVVKPKLGNQRITKRKPSASYWLTEGSGALFGIDQEVVTLRGLSRQLPGLGLKRLADVPRDASPRATDAMPPSVLTG